MADSVTDQKPLQAVATLMMLVQHSVKDTHTVVLQLFWIWSGTTRVSRYQKGKTNLDLLEQEIVSGSGICWAICNAYSLQPPAISPPVGDT